MSGSPRLAATLQRSWLGRRSLAWALWPLSRLYGLIVRCRTLAYRLGLLRSVRLPVPVIVVGNLIAGGAGKTPTVLSLVERLRALGHRPGIVSRGHGRRGDAVLEVEPATDASHAGDEPLLLRRRAGVPVFVGRDRVAAGAALLRWHADVTILVADDGLQHHRLARDAQVIVFDERGAGNGWLLPAGPLREPMSDGVPPRSVVLYNAPRPTTTWPGYVARRRLGGIVELADWHAGRADRAVPVETLRSLELVAVAGIAQPDRFFALLRDAGLRFSPLPLEDHAAFDLLPWPASTRDVIVTEKDAVKIAPPRIGATRVWVATLDFEPEAAFDAALARLLPPPPDGNPPA